MIPKFVWEEFHRAIQFRRADGRGPLAAEETLTSATAVVIDSAGEEHPAMISNVSVYNSTQVRYRIAAGMPGGRYQIRFQVITNTGQKFEERIPVMVS